MELTVVKNDFSEIIQPDPQKGDMKEELPTRVCFICTGNICRSPMAAAALNKYGKGKYRAVSAGLAICDGDKISQNAVLVLSEAGIESTSDNNYKEHRARQVTEEIIASSDSVVAMTRYHMLQLIYAFPSHASKISVMPEEISDPYMGDLDRYRECFEQIVAGLKEVYNL